MSYAHLGASASAEFNFDASGNVNVPTRSGPPVTPSFNPLEQPNAVCGEGVGVASVVVRDNGTWTLVCNNGYACAGNGPNDNGKCQAPGAGTKPPAPPPPPPPQTGGVPKLGTNQKGGGCPPATGTLYPAGLSPQHLDLLRNMQSVEKMICNDAITGNGLLAPTAAECNTSISPSFCYFAKAYNQQLLGRGGTSDVAAWRAWHPAQPKPFLLSAIKFGFPSPGMTQGGDIAPSPDPVTPSSGVPTWALLVGGAAVLGTVGYFVWKSKKALGHGPDQPQETS